MKYVEVTFHKDVDNALLCLAKVSNSVYNTVSRIQHRFATSTVIAQVIDENLSHRFMKTFDNNPYGSSEWYYECRLCRCLESVYKPINPPKTCWEVRHPMRPDEISKKNQAL